MCSEMPQTDNTGVALASFFSFNNWGTATAVQLLLSPSLPSVCVSAGQRDMSTRHQIITEQPRYVEEAIATKSHHRSLR